MSTYAEKATQTEVLINDKTSHTGTHLVGSQEHVEELRAKLESEIEKNAYNAVMNWGGDASKMTVSYADKLLSTVSSKDVSAGEHHLRTILENAKSINLTGLDGSQSRIPVIGAIINKFRRSYGSIKADFMNAKQAIEAAAGEMGQVQGKLAQRIKDLDEAFGNVEREYKEINDHIEAGRAVNREIERAIETVAEQLRKEPNDSIKAQYLNDLEALSSRLTKRCDDLTVLRENAANTLPAIRIIQSNNAMLVDKFHAIISITIPTWKRQMMMGLCLDEQESAVALAQDADDFTNSLLRQQAIQLKRNSIATARSNNRLVIDVETIKFQQDKLIETVNEVRSIQQSAEECRKTAMQNLEEMRENFNLSLIKNDADIGDVIEAGTSSSTKKIEHRESSIH